MPPWPPVSASPLADELPPSCWRDAFGVPSPFSIFPYVVSNPSVHGRPDISSSARTSAFDPLHPPLPSLSGRRRVAGWGLVRTHAAGAVRVLPRPRPEDCSALRFSHGWIPGSTLAAALLHRRVDSSRDGQACPPSGSPGDSRDAGSASNADAACKMRCPSLLDPVAHGESRGAI